MPTSYPFDRLLSPRLSPFDLFDRELHRAAPRSPEAAFATDVAETDSAFEIVVDLPGFAESDVHVSVHDDTVAIRAERKDAPREGKKLHLQERRTSAFARSFAIGQPIDAEGVTAQMKNGVLTVTVPKSKAAGARHIPVTVA
jgi:HSP20 family protein